MSAKLFKNNFIELILYIRLLAGQGNTPKTKAI